MSRGFEYVSNDFRKNENNVEDVGLPRRGTSKSAGYDFKSPIDAIIKPKEIKLIWSDVKAYMMDDEELLIFPRSSMGKLKVKLANTVAKIDADYHNNPKTDGNIGLMIENDSDVDFVINKGDRVCQGTFSKYLITDDDCPVSDERVGGMGSTGK